ncbi:MAG: M20 family metallopeptidase [Flavobacteriaceae bacterium]|nr:M20 family metallopeptidase [Flavobacteriaceae bacterium]
MTLTKDISREVLDTLDKQKGKMLEFLKELVHLESPSNNVALQHQILELLEKTLTKMGYFTLRIKGSETGGSLYARPLHRQKGIPFQLLIGHCDTVWPEGTLAGMPVTENDTTLRGPGVYDMKAGITQIIYALKTLQSIQQKLPFVPVILFNTDEEIGSNDSTRTIRCLARKAARAYVLEPPLGTDGKLKTARKGIGRFTITVQGVAAHAGLDPDKGVNAIVELSHQVQKLYAMNDHNRGITVNIGTIEGGISPNVVAPISKAVIDVRVLTKADGEDITKRIFELKPLNKEVTLNVEGGIGRPPMERTYRNKELWELARREGRRLGLELEEAVAGGGSDANTTSLYTATIDGLGTPGDGAHASREYILKNKLIERTALLSLLLMAAP